MSFAALVDGDRAIVKRILDFLHEDRKALAAVCLVSKDLIAPASSVLYHTVSVKSFSGFEHAWRSEGSGPTAVGSTLR